MTNTLPALSDLKLLLELLSCSGDLSVVRGPSEGHMRTEGGHSSPAPGYLGNTTDTVQQCSLSESDKFTVILNKTACRHDVITPCCMPQTRTKVLQRDFPEVNVCISWMDLSRECINSAEKC